MAFWYLIALKQFLWTLFFHLTECFSVQISYNWLKIFKWNAPSTWSYIVSRVFLPRMKFLMNTRDKNMTSRLVGGLYLLGEERMIVEVLYYLNCIFETKSYFFYKQSWTHKYVSHVTNLLSWNINCVLWRVWKRTLFSQTYCLYVSLSLLRTISYNEHWSLKNIA